MKQRSILREIIFYAIVIALIVVALSAGSMDKLESLIKSLL